MLVKKLLKFSAMFWSSDIILPSAETDDEDIVLLFFFKYMVSLTRLHKALEFVFVF